MGDKFKRLMEWDARAAGAQIVDYKKYRNNYILQVVLTAILIFLVMLFFFNGGM